MPVINGKYYTEEEVERIRRKSSAEEFDKFLVSGVVGFVTGSTIIVGLIGGSFLGGLLGDTLEGTDDSFF